jgi:DNA-binding response OmpR family regulator
MSGAVRESGVSALLVGEYETDRILMRELFREFGWRLFEANDRRRAMDCLNRNPVHVVITESNLPRWNWRRALSDLRRLNQPPQLIVTSRTADDYLWAEVLNIGGFDVLAQPLEREEVERVISAARRHFDLPVRAMSQGGMAPAASVA